MDSWRNFLGRVSHNDGSLDKIGLPRIREYMYGRGVLFCLGLNRMCEHGSVVTTICTAGFV